jgi:hypothetical protein
MPIGARHESGRAAADAPKSQALAGLTRHRAAKRSHPLVRGASLTPGSAVVLHPVCGGCVTPSVGVQRTPTVAVLA